MFAGAAGLVALGTYLATSSNTESHKEEEQPKTAPAQPAAPQVPDCANVIIGDVGGTNVRLQLMRIYHDPAKQHMNETLKRLVKYSS